MIMTERSCQSIQATTKREDGTYRKILALDLGKFNTICGFYGTKTRKDRKTRTSLSRSRLPRILGEAKAACTAREYTTSDGRTNNRPDHDDCRSLKNVGSDKKEKCGRRQSHRKC